MEEKNAVCIQLLNGTVLICKISNLGDNWVSISNPYSFEINVLDNKTIQFVPYMREFTNDNIFDINVNNIVSIFKPFDKYTAKYIEITTTGSNQQLLTE